MACRAAASPARARVSSCRFSASESTGSWAVSTPHNSTLLYIPRTSGYVDTGSMVTERAGNTRNFLETKPLSHALRDSPPNSGALGSTHKVAHYAKAAPIRGGGIP